MDLFVESSRQNHQFPAETTTKRRTIECLTAENFPEDQTQTSGHSSLFSKCTKTYIISLSSPCFPQLNDFDNAKMPPLPLPENWRVLDKFIDIDSWDTEVVEPSEPETHTKKIINGYILYHSYSYRAVRTRNSELWKTVRGDFRGWTNEMWNLSDKPIISIFRDYLRAHGVYVRKKSGSSVVENLQVLFTETEQHPWTEEEIKELTTELKKINKTAEMPEVLATPLVETPTIPRPPREVGENDLYDSDTPGFPYDSDEDDENAEKRGKRGRAAREPGDPHPAYPGADTNKPLVDLMKFYNDDAKRYTGELYDIFDTKLSIFYDCCMKVGLGKEQYHNAFSSMLKGRAEVFYFERLSRSTVRDYDFNYMVERTRKHFETEENRQEYMAEWRETTLPSMTAKHPTKNKLECLQLVIDKLCVIQRGLSLVYQTEYNLRDQIINACRGVKECDLALYKPARTFEGVCAELRSAVGTAMRSHDSVDLKSAKLFVFVDGSFANNKDLSSQLGCELVIATEREGENSFTIRGNIIHWTSVKSHRVTRSALASEVLAMVLGADLAFVLSTTIRMITNKHGIPPIPTIVCTDSLSLYESLVKLGTTTEKRLMIDVMALRESYEKRELHEVRWISGPDNPADAMTKSVPNKALETLISTNELTIRVEGWVKRGDEGKPK